MRKDRVAILAIILLFSTAGCSDAFHTSSEKTDEQQPGTFSTEDDSSSSEDNSQAEDDSETEITDTESPNPANLEAPTPPNNSSDSSETGPTGETAIKPEWAQPSSLGYKGSIALEDGSLLRVGHYNGSPPVDSLPSTQKRRLAMVKYSESGQVLQSGISEKHEIMDIHALDGNQNGRFAVAGDLKREDSDEDLPFVVVFSSSNLAPVWLRIYNQTPAIQLNKLALTNEQNLVVGGEDQASSKTDKIFMTKFSAKGKRLWHHHYRANDIGINGLTATAERISMASIIITGGQGTSTTRKNWLEIRQLNSDGDSLWTRTAPIKWRAQYVPGDITIETTSAGRLAITGPRWADEGFADELPADFRFKSRSVGPKETGTGQDHHNDSTRSWGFQKIPMPRGFFVAVLTRDGDTVSNKTFKTKNGNPIVVQDLATGPEKNLYVSGLAEDSITLGDSNMTGSPKHPSQFIAEFSLDGQSSFASETEYPDPLWEGQIRPYSSDISVSSAGSIYLTTSGVAAKFNLSN